METTLHKQRRLHLSPKTSTIIADVVIYLFVALFVYTAASKLTTLETFEQVLGKSSLLSSYHVFIARLIPITEIIISILLILPSTKKLGLYLSLGLMLVFTTYLIYMVLSGGNVICHCGGVISSLTWKQHIWFNIGFIMMAIAGLKLYKK